jgi:plasmid stabilization system protein ParE
VKVIRWTPQAAEDLEALHNYIASGSALYASAVVGRIIESLDKLAEFPLSGRVVPEQRREELREIVTPPYRCVYLIKNEVLWIVTIFHGARPLPNIREP